jgi:hypothetical protein
MTGVGPKAMSTREQMSAAKVDIARREQSAGKRR